MPTPLDQLVDTFDDTLPLSRARTIPADWYTHPQMYQTERERIFARCWLLAGRAEQVANSGMYFTREIAGVPLLVARGDDGELRAFHNVCRHRAARVACDAEGCATRFRCRYHGWTYDLSGRLRGVPEFDGVEEFRREDNGLPQLSAEVWGGLVWVHQGTPTIPLGEWVAPLEKLGFTERMARLHFVARREYPLACDWKVFCDNYLDGGYHINYIHPGLAGVLDYSQYRTEIENHVSVQISPLTSRKGAESVAAVRGGTNAYYAWVFPNLMINLYDDLMDTNLVLPAGPGRCRVVFDFYFANTGDGAQPFINDSIALAHQVQLEDGDICEDVQRGLTSGAFDVGRFSARREGAGYHFHQLLARWLRG